MIAEMHAALTEREDLIEKRARVSAQSAVQSGKPWLTTFGPPPQELARREKWTTAVAMVAAYRDRWSVEAGSVLGHPRSDQQRLEADLARRAVRRAHAIADDTEALRVRMVDADLKGAQVADR